MFRIPILAALFYLIFSSCNLFAQDQVKMKIQKGHVASVIYADISPDGKKVATLGGYIDGLLIVWDVETGRELLNIKLSKRNLSSVKFSPDGKYVITTDQHLFVKIIEIETGKIIREHQFKWGTYYAEFAPDNKSYLVLDYDSTYVFDSQSGEELLRFSNDDMRAESAAYSPDSKKIIVAYPERAGTIRIFNLENPNDTFVMHGVDSSLRGAVFDEDGKHFYSQGNYLKTWRIKRKKLKDKKPIDSYSFLSPDRMIYASPTNFDECNFFDVQTNQKIFDIPETELVYFYPKVIQNENSRTYYFLTIPRNFVVMYIDMIKNYTELWELTITNKKTRLRKIQRFDGRVENINVVKSGNKNRILVGGDFYLNLWNLNEMRNTHRYDDHIQPIIHVDIDSLSENFIASTGYCFVKTWHTKRQEAIRSYEWDKLKAIGQILFSKDMKYILAGRYDGEPMIWDIENDSAEYSFTIPGLTYGNSVFSPYGDYVATPTWDSVLIHNINTHKLQLYLPRQIREPVADVKFSPDNKSILTYCEKEDSLVLWDIETGKVINYYKPSDRLYRFSPDGQSIIVHKDKAFYILDSESRQLERKIPVNHVVHSFDITRDQKYIVSLGEGMIKLWDLESGKEIVTMVGIYGREPEFVIYTPDGYYMSTRNGINGVHFIRNNVIYLFDQFDVKYNRPDIVLKRVGYASEYLVDAYHKAYLKRLKKMGFKEEDLSGEFHMPKSAIRKFKYMPVIEEKDIQIDLNFNDSKYKLDRYNIWINDVPVFGMKGKSLKNLNTDSFSVTEKLSLSEGSNKIQVSCLNEKGAESYKETEYITYEPKKSEKPDLYLIAVSVSNYQQSEFNLKYAVKDGRDLVNAYAENQQKQFKQIHIDTLFNRDATLQNVITLKKKLMQTDVDDHVILYVSGHGLLGDNLDFYFASYDMDFSDPALRGISYDILEGLLDSIPARKKLFLMDACHSGEVDKEAVEGEEKLSENDITASSFKKGIVLLDAPKLGLQNTFELMQELICKPEQRLRCAGDLCCCRKQLCPGIGSMAERGFYLLNFIGIEGFKSRQKQ